MPDELNNIKWSLIHLPNSINLSNFPNKVKLKRKKRLYFTIIISSIIAIFIYSSLYFYLKYQREQVILPSYESLEKSIDELLLSTTPPFSTMMKKPISSFEKQDFILNAISDSLPLHLSLTSYYFRDNKIELIVAGNESLAIDFSEKLWNVIQLPKAYTDLNYNDDMNNIALEVKLKSYNLDSYSKDNNKELKRIFTMH